MLGPPVFTTQEEADAYLDAQKDIYGGGAAGVARGLGIVDLFAGVPWLAAETYGHQALDSLLAQEKRLDKQKYEELQRLKLRSEGLLGQQGDDEEAKKKTKKRARARINPLEAETYDESIEEFLKTFGYERNERSKIAEDVSFWTTVGVDLAFLAKVVIQNAPKGYRAVRDALKNIGKNVDETDQAVMKAQTETGFSDTPVQMEMDLPKAKAKTIDEVEKPWGDEIYEMEARADKLYDLETRMYDLKNLLRQEGTTMSKTNLDKLMREIAQTDYEIRKLTAAGAATGITVSGEAKSPDAEEVQSSVNYALKQWM